ncbi:MAG: hypothetical protein AAGA20_22855 [Planctomycetota bacterium]
MSVLFLALVPFGATAEAAPALPGPVAEEWTEGGDAQLLFDRRRVQLITRLSNQLLDLDAAELDVAAIAHPGATELDLVLAIVLRAGRPIPPGLAAARRSQREARAKEALDWLELELAAEGGDQLVLNALRSALASDGPAAASIPELRVAAAHVVAELELVQLAPIVARLLAEESRPEVRSGARAALFRLYARWYESAEDFEERWRPLRGLPPAATGRDELARTIEVANERALRLIELAEFEGELLDWPDPGMAARASRAVGRAVAAGGIDPTEARTILLDGLVETGDPEELHARLGVLLDLVQGADPLGDAATGVRAALVEVTGTAHAKGPPTAWVAIGALPRLPFPEGAEGDAYRAPILETGVDAFQRALRKRNERPLDPDALEGAILALRDLALAIDDPELRATVAEPLARSLPGLVRDDALPMGVRRAAASSLTLSSNERSARILVALIGDANAGELEYELFGSLEAVSAGLSPGSQAAEDIVEELFESLAKADFDRRARALELLLSDGLREVLRHDARRTEARWCVLRLVPETSPELRIGLLDLLAQIGDADVVQLALSEPELVEQIATSDTEVARALARTVGALSAESPERGSTVLGLADRIAGELGTAEALDPERVQRLRIALDAVLALDVETARALPPAAHRWALRAAIDLRRADPVLVPARLGSEARSRLLGVHAAALAAFEAGEEDVALTALAKGLFGSDEQLAALSAPTEDAAPGPDRERAIDVAVAGFDAAVAESEVAAGLGWDARRLRFECVDFLRATGRIPAAQSRLGALFDELEAAEGSPDPASVRDYAELARAVVEAESNEGTRALAARAARGMAELVSAEAWNEEDPTTAVRDLSILAGLVERAEAGADRTAALRALVERVEGESVPMAEWRERVIEGDPAAFGALNDAVARLQGRSVESAQDTARRDDGT